MKGKVLAAVLVTGGILLLLSLGTGVFAFMSWALALNGFMGQDRAVNASLITLIILGVVFSLACIGLGMAAVYYLSGKREWNAAVSSIVAIVVFSVACGGLQFLSVIVSAVVATEMKTTKQVR